MTQRVEVGKLAGVYGVQGWIKVRSYTEPPEAILDYSPWYLSKHGEHLVCDLLDGRCHGRGLVVCLQYLDERELAAKWNGAQVLIERVQLPPLAADEYYWTDLIGCRVVTTAGVDLGTLRNLLATGANDVLVVQGERERLLPFVQGEVVTSVDLAARLIVVDWDPEF